MSIPAAITDHEGEALELLTEQFKGRPVIEGMVKAFAARTQILEDVVWDVINGRLLADCEGVWLDAYGAIVGESRQGRTDTIYRAAVRLRIRVNRSKGRAVDVLDVATLCDPSAVYLEMGQASFRVTILNLAPARDVAKLIDQTRAVGTQGVFVSSSVPAEDVFMFGETWGEGRVFGYRLLGY